MDEDVIRLDLGWRETPRGIHQGTDERPDKTRCIVWMVPACFIFLSVSKERRSERSGWEVEALNAGARVEG